MAGRAKRGGARGKIPKEVQDIFEKYQANNVRQLTKPDALSMLQTEFGLSPEQSENMFETFDKDLNGIMSIWEFQQFYQTVGGTAADMVAKFQELDKDGSGKLDPEEAKEGLMSMKDASGRSLEQREIEFFLKSSTGEDGQIDLGHFANLLYTLKLYKGKPQGKKK